MRQRRLRRLHRRPHRQTRVRREHARQRAVRAGDEGGRGGGGSWGRVSSPHVVQGLVCGGGCGGWRRGRGDGSLPLPHAALAGHALGAGGGGCEVGLSVCGECSLLLGVLAALDCSAAVAVARGVDEEEGGIGGGSHLGPRVDDGLGQVDCVLRDLLLQPTLPHDGGGSEGEGGREKGIKSDYVVMRARDRLQGAGVQEEAMRMRRCGGAQLRALPAFRRWRDVE